MRRRAWEVANLPQIVIGLAVTREGIPVRCWVWPGNTTDTTVIEEVGRGALNPSGASGTGAAMLSMTLSDGPVTGGVDTHSHTHHAAVIDHLSRHLGDREFPATPGGYRALAC